jgi:hypothetical protein
MSSTEVDTIPGAPAVPAATAQWIGQATAVEQARAVAEVQAAVVVAQQVPRDLTSAVTAMRESCRQKGLADRAFFRFPRAGSTISGPSVHLARELARCWGNVQYGIREMRRDDTAGISEMQAWAWDVQTNTRSEQMFVVPHKRDTKEGVKALVDLRDVYENNANLGARRLREAIFAILPTWFTEEAKELCTKTLQDGGGKSLAQQAADVVRGFEGFGVSVDQLEQKTGRAKGKWTEHDLAQLRVVGASLRQGTVTVDDEFPPERVTAEEIHAASKSKPTPKTAQPALVPDADPWASDAAKVAARDEEVTG